MFDQFDFSDLKPIAIPVTGHNGKRYILREATAGAARDFRNAAVRGARMQDGRVVGIDGVGDAPFVLLAGCLFERVTISGEEKERPVPLVELVKWPQRVVGPLFEAAKQISELDQDDTEEALLKQRAEIDGKLAGLAQKAAAEKNGRPLGATTSP